MTCVLGISVDCANAPLLAEFWARALDAQIIGGPSRNLAVLEVGTQPGALRLVFRRVTEGKFVRNRVRLDLITDNFELETARLLSLGAIRLDDITDGRRRWTTFADIEGNEFDLIDGWKDAPRR